MTYVKPIATLKQNTRSWGIDVSEPDSEEEAGFDPVVPWGSLSPDTVIYATGEKRTAFCFQQGLIGQSIRMVVPEA